MKKRILSGIMTIGIITTMLMSSIPNIMTYASDDVESIPENHIHTEVFIDNGDGTHTITCDGILDESSQEYLACDFESIIEEHAFDENGVCLCGAVYGSGMQLIEQNISTEYDNRVFTATGMIPKNAELIVSECDNTIEELEERLNEESSDFEIITIYEAYDIKLTVGDEKYQPVDDNNIVNISIKGIPLDENTDNTTVVYHINDADEIEILPVDVVSDEIIFETESFTPFIVAGVTYSDTNAIASYGLDNARSLNFSYVVSAPAAINVTIDPLTQQLAVNMPISIQQTSLADEAHSVTVTASDRFNISNDYRSYTMEATNNRSIVLENGGVAGDTSIDGTVTYNCEDGNLIAGSYAGTITLQMSQN